MILKLSSVIFLVYFGAISVSCSPFQVITVVGVLGITFRVCQLGDT